MRKMRRFRSSCACVKYHGLCFPFIHSVVSNDSVSGQRRPWSDCADAQADLGLRCPDMHKARSFQQHAHPLTKNFVVHIKTLCILGYPKFAQWRFWPDCANAQPYLNLRWAHMSEGKVFFSLLPYLSSVIQIVSSEESEEAELMHWLTGTLNGCTL